MSHFFRKRLLLAAFLIGMLLPLAAQSTQVVVYLNDDTEQTFYLSEEDRMYFEDDQKLVIELIYTKDVVKFNLNDIRKITCHETESTTESAENQVSIFPNPVHNTLILRNLPGKQTVSIYAVDGRLMMTFKALGDQAINVSELPSGLYLVKTETQTLKMIKL